MEDRSDWARGQRSPPLRFLDADGRAVAAPPGGLREAAALIHLYRAMVRARAFGAKAIALQRTVRLGTYPSCMDQEALGVGVANAMHPDDVLVNPRTGSRRPSSGGA